MNTILSIDLDILFTPYIGIYGPKIAHVLNYEVDWQNIADNYNIYSFFPNQEYHEILFDIIQYYSQQVSKIYIGEDHSTILTALEKEKSSFETPYSFNIYNIDYHHDISYNEAQSNDIQNCFAGCANWVGFLSYNDFLNEYHWYHAPESEFFKSFLNQDMAKNIMPQNFFEENFSNNFPMDLKIDMLYITYSLPLIPPCYYILIKKILEDLDQDKLCYLPYHFRNGSFKEPFLSLENNQDYEVFKFLYDKIL